MTAAALLPASSLLLILLAAGAVLGARTLDRERAAASVTAHEACRACMGPTWGQPDEPQPTAADFERCCPELPGPVCFGCQWEIERVCRTLDPVAEVRCDEAAFRLCSGLVPPAAWLP